MKKFRWTLVVEVEDVDDIAAVARVEEVLDGMLSNPDGFVALGKLEEIRNNVKGE